MFLEVVEPSKKNGLMAAKFGSKPMPYRQVLTRLRQRLQQIGVSAEEALLYSTHSMRRTGNAVDRSKGVPKQARQVKGQWQTERGMVPYEDDKAMLEMRGERQQAREDIDAYLR